MRSGQMYGTLLMSMMEQSSESANLLSPSADEVREAIRIMEQLATDRGLLEQVSQDEMHRLLRAAEKIAIPSRADRRRLKRAFLKREHEERERLKRADAQHLAFTLVCTIIAAG